MLKELLPPVASWTQPNRFVCAAGEMLHVAEPFLERNLHPTVIVRGFHRALEDAVAIVDDMAFPIDVNDRGQMLKILNSTVGTKYTARFGDLLAVNLRRLSDTLVWSRGVRISCLWNPAGAKKRRKRLGKGSHYESLVGASAPGSPERAAKHPGGSPHPMRCPVN